MNTTTLCNIILQSVPFSNKNIGKLQRSGNGKITVPGTDLDLQIRIAAGVVRASEILTGKA